MWVPNQRLSRIRGYIIDAPIFVAYLFGDKILQVGGVFSGLYFASHDDFRTAALAGGLPYTIGKIWESIAGLYNRIEDKY